MLDRIRIVLVSPSGPANIGAVCRAMANLGLRDLYIVAPRCDPRDEAAIAYSTHGLPVLDAARIVDDLPTALAGCVRSYATSSKLGLYRRQAAITPAQAAREAVPFAATGPVALAFGREDYGLQTRELLQFDRLITIPTDADVPVMNLAVSVAICAYELRLAALDAAQQPPLPMTISSGLATAEKKEVLFERLFDALDRVGFLFGQSPDHLKYALRHLFGRIDLSVNECDILIGLARQIRWYVDHHPQRLDPPSP